MEGQTRSKKARVCFILFQFHFPQFLRQPSIQPFSETNARVCVVVFV
jgi:hypothetical protein